MTRDEAILRSNDLFTYDPESGILYHKSCKYRPCKVGMPVGRINSRGYFSTKISGYTFTVHRIIWFMHCGEQPEMIDHVNGVRSDNRIVNLRAATRSQNLMNRGSQSNNKLGIKGVRFQADCIKPYRAAIKIDKRNKHLGLFENPEEAHQAYLRAAMKLHGEFFHG